MLNADVRQVPFSTDAAGSLGGRAGAGGTKLYRSRAPPRPDNPSGQGERPCLADMGIDGSGRSGLARRGRAGRDDSPKAPAPSASPAAASSSRNSRATAVVTFTLRRAKAYFEDRPSLGLSLSRCILLGSEQPPQHSTRPSSLAVPSVGWRHIFRGGTPGQERELQDHPLPNICGESSGPGRQRGDQDPKRADVFPV